MSKTNYTPEQKGAALIQLERNAGNVSLTAQQTNIPERTLYTWHRQFYAQYQQRQSSAPLPPKETPQLEGSVEALQFLRERIVEELVNL